MARLTSHIFQGHAKFVTQLLIFSEFVVTLYFPPKAFKPAPLVRGEWRRRYPCFAVADYAEGARRDRYEWARFREPFSVREALSTEYDGARLNAGLPFTEHRRAVVVIRESLENRRLERMLVPLAAAADLSMPASQWWALACECNDRELWGDHDDRMAVVVDFLPLPRGTR